MAYLVRAEPLSQGFRSAHDVRRADPVSDLPLISATLARAFQDDPVMSWLLPDARQRAARLPGFWMHALGGLHGRHGSFFTTAAFTGAAVWDPPGHWKVEILQMIRFAPAFVRIFRIHCLRGLALLNAVERYHPREPHYYLFAIGTDPAHQGRGIGASLLAPVLAKCDGERMPAYLESSNERNVPFYQRNGFRVMREISVPDGPKITLMRRPAGGG
ncbi:MAG TPA: GNAT family N-acetyltransferase [Deltaproteobacteria bacterium]|jgi:GNAT superfamily N-acetyltransferase|nr:GNAT family N-acetyltransferase [Deltaproteobacteria bacterium]